MGRRAAGEGSIHKTRDGKRWEAWLELPPDPITGKRRRRRLRAKTKTEAAARLDEARKELAVGVVTGRNVRLEDHLDRWVDAREASGTIAASTVDNYRQLIKLIKPILGRRRVRDLRPSDIDELAVRLLAAGYAPATVSRTRAVLSGALKAAVRDGLIATNPVAVTRAPRQRPAVRRFLTVEQIRKLLVHAASVDADLEAMLAVSIGSGLRRGELLALRWADIDLEARTIRVTRQLVRRTGHGLEESELKTAASVRSVSLPSIAIDALGQHQVRHPGLPSALVFADAAGGYYPPERWSRQVTAATEAALGEKFGAHDLRHASASLAFAAGVPLRVVSEQLGHTSVAVTGDIYVALVGGTSDVGPAIDGVLETSR